MASLQVKPPLLWSAGILWPVACTAVIAARFITRRARGNRYGWDDWLTIPAWVFTCGLSASLLVGVAEKAMGYPTPAIDPQLSLVATSKEQTVTRKIYYVFLVLHTPALAFIKLSCVAYYGRLFRTGLSKTTDVLLGGLMFIIIAWGIAFTVSGLFSCGTLKHLDYLWTSLENQEKCTVNSAMLQKALALSDVIMDVLLLVFPMPHIWRLNMTLRSKFGLSIIFVFGSLSLAASIVRLVILVQALNVEFQAHVDEDFLSTGAAYFMLLEAGFGLIAICLPTLAGAMHLEGVQTFFANISQTLSIRSQSTQDTPNSPVDGTDSAWRSGLRSLGIVPSKGKPADTQTQVIALRSLSAETAGTTEITEPDAIHVAKTVEP